MKIVFHFFYLLKYSILLFLFKTNIDFLKIKIKIYEHTIRSYLQLYSAIVTPIGIASNSFVSIEE